ncbi:MAG: Bug family tripartite tricarboxylate transporter substrate binding protein [Burkholderiales bacterium]
MAKVISAFCGFVVACLFATAAFAQSDWPTRPVKVIVPYPPGGFNDIVARTVADKLTQILGQPFLVENRAGAATTVASNFVARAPADGYTIYAAGTSLVINPALQGKVEYDPIKDFAPISLTSLTPFVFHVNAAFPPKDMKELVTLVRANPDKFAISSSGVGAVNHMAAELFRAETKLKITLVPYKGGAPAGQDLAAGIVHMMFSATLEAVPLLQGGRTRALAISSRTRSSAFPDLPTIEEALGLNGFDAVFWQAMVAPAATPKPIIDRLQNALVQVLADPVLKDRFAKQGTELKSSSPQELGERIEQEEKRWSTLIRTLGIKAE